MSTIGQIIYNLKDANSGGLTSTSNSDVTQTISSVDNPTYDTDKIDIFNTNIVSRFGGSGFIKLGVQAEPGTRVILNKNKVILIGKTGIYELDDILITDMQFDRPKKYELKEQETQTALAEGMEGMGQAEEARDAALAALTLEEPTLSDEDYWKKYTKIQETYDAAYQKALVQFNTGLNGVYGPPNPAEPNAPENFDELYNIIVDFIY